MLFCKCFSSYPILYIEFEQKRFIQLAHNTLFYCLTHLLTKEMFVNTVSSSMSHNVFVFFFFFWISKDFCSSLSTFLLFQHCRFARMVAFQIMSRMSFKAETFTYQKLLTHHRLCDSAVMRSSNVKLFRVKSIKCLFHHVIAK